MVANGNSHGRMFVESAEARLALLSGPLGFSHTPTQRVDLVSQCQRQEHKEQDVADIGPEVKGLEQKRDAKPRSTPQQGEH